MTPIKCASSKLITRLLSWRAPQEGNELVLFDEEGKDTRTSRFRVITTQIGLFGLSTVAAIESVAYSILTLASCALQPITDRPRHLFTKLLQSSSFSIIWGIFGACTNRTTVIWQESCARFLAQLGLQCVYQPHHCPIECFRAEDRLASGIDENMVRFFLQNNDELAPMVLLDLDNLSFQQELTIQQGAEFLSKEVLTGASFETLCAFKNSDPAIYLFVITKAIYTYVWGSKSTTALPDFFKFTTRAHSQNLRQNVPNAQTIDELKKLLENPAQFELGTKNEATKAAFKDLRAAASQELQGSAFTTTCWQRAGEILSK